MKRRVGLICQAIALNSAVGLFILSRNDLEYSASSSPADRLLHLLKTRGPQLASDAGEYLGTTGEAARQQLVKLAASGLAEWFDGVEILPEKDVTHYRSLLRRWGADGERFVMVGNSVRSDILPVLELGGWAILVPSANQWAHEVAEPPWDHPRFAVTPSLANAVALCISQQGI